MGRSPRLSSRIDQSGEVIDPSDCKTFLRSRTHLIPMNIDEFMRALDVPRPYASPGREAVDRDHLRGDVDEADRDLPADEFVHGWRHALVG